MGWDFLKNHHTLMGEVKGLASEGKGKFVEQLQHYQLNKLVLSYADLDQKNIFISTNSTRDGGADVVFNCAEKTPKPKWYGGGEPVQLDMVFVAHHGYPKTDEVKVPALGERIIEYLCRPELLEGVLGCLEESYRRQVDKHGLAAARRWYWWQVTRSVIAFGWDIAMAIGKFAK